MKLVIVESPFQGDRPRNLGYVRAAMADCFDRNEAPFASHALYTQPGVLNDDDHFERQLGIRAGLLWGSCAELTAVYIDYGVSPGMQLGIATAKVAGRRIEYRTLGKFAAAWTISEDNPESTCYLPQNGEDENRSH